MEESNSLSECPEMKQKNVSLGEVHTPDRYVEIVAYGSATLDKDLQSTSERKTLLRQFVQKTMKTLEKNNWMDIGFMLVTSIFKNQGVIK